VLDRIFNYSHPARIVADGFGLQLNSSNIESHLQRIREDCQQWRASHPEDVEEIKALKK